MKDNFLKELKEELINVNANDIDSILKKYEARYDFGLESELSCEEIEQMLGNPKDIAAKYKNNSKVKKEVNSDVVIKTVNDDIIIEKSNDDKIHMLFDGVDFDLYSSHKDCISEKGVIFEFLKSKYFGLNRKTGGIITLQIPEGRTFNKVYLYTQNGDIKLNEIECNSFELNTQNGDITIKKIKALNTKFHTVSGDISCYKIESNDTRLSNVSGDIVIHSISGNNLVIDTVSGDVCVRTCDAKYKTSSVVGEVIVNGENCGSLKKNIKGVFGRHER